MILEQRIVNRTKPRCRRLNRFAQKVYSQTGEDGILRQIIKETGLPETGGWCVEFGAWDGVKYSNTCNLIRHHDYHGVMIEGDSSRYTELLNNHGDNPRVHCIAGIVGFEAGVDTLDDWLGTTPIPTEFELLSIDIDGNDYYIWESLVRFRPHIVIIEINPTIPNDVVFVQDRDFSISQGCSLLALVELGKQKGYELVCTTKHNAIFVLEQDYPALHLPSNAPDDIHFSNSGQGRLFQGMDGTLFNIGLKPQWRLGKSVIAPDQFQVLDKHHRRFSDNMAHKLMREQQQRDSAESQEPDQNEE